MVPLPNDTSNLETPAPKCTVAILLKMCKMVKKKSARMLSGRVQAHVQKDLKKRENARRVEAEEGLF